MEHRINEAKLYGSLGAPEAWICLANSPIAGMGIFATRNIKSGSFITPSYGTAEL